MRLKRSVSLAGALRYRGEGPMLTFILHRIGGLGMAIFITVHILAGFLGGKTGVYVNSLYESWAFQLFIIFCVLFHAINGLRITILDLWPSLLVHQREAIWLEWMVFLPVYGLAVFVVVRGGLAGGV
jgi:succinate dehydrogenase / fumarate reductase cytochrome b subunit